MWRRADDEQVGLIAEAEEGLGRRGRLTGQRLRARKQTKGKKPKHHHQNHGDSQWMESGQ